jgi:hypothetical protein
MPTYVDDLAQSGTEKRKHELGFFADRRIFSRLHVHAIERVHEGPPRPDYTTRRARARASV